MHYLDNSATTAVGEKAAAAVCDIMKREYGNPSSLHKMGYKASLVLENSREAVASSLGCENREVYFTSGGTEANNMAVLSSARAGRRAGNKIVTTAIEHPSVLECMKKLEDEGFRVIYIKPDCEGKITRQQLSQAIDGDTILVSVMCVNNETGLVLPIEEIPGIIKRKKAPALFHTDFVQGYGKIPCKVKKIGCDLLTVSAHKVRGPKGVGALFIKRGTKLKPRTYGGMQENRIRCGTEATPLIGGFAQAVKEFDIQGNKLKVSALQGYCMEKIREIPGIDVNSGDFPYIINISTNCVMSQTMLSFLSDKYDVCVSSGSACHKGEMSHVLKAYGYSPDRINSALRISFCSDNTREDIDAFIKGLRGGIENLVHFRTG